MCKSWIAVLLEFRAQEGRDPDINHVDADADKLKQIAVEMLKSQSINEDFLDMDFTAYVSAVYKFNYQRLIIVSIGLIFKNIKVV